MGTRQAGQYPDRDHFRQPDPRRGLRHRVVCTPLIGTCTLGGNSMRHFAYLLVVLACGTAYAQQAKTSDIPASSSPTVAGHRLTKVNGETVLITEYKKVGMFYHVTDRSWKRTQVFETSVK